MSSLETLAGLVGAQLIGARGAEVDVVDVVADSRRIVAGALFCCVRGERHDGHEHAEAAVADGAVALLCERAMDVGVPQLVVPDVRSAMAPVAAEVHGHPSRRLDVIGVTGTNGKTTVVSMVAAIMDGAGRRALQIGTLTGERTTPEAPDLQRTLAAAVVDGVDVVAMEVSSHALVMHRVDAVEFAVAVFTNLGVDHLDFHGTPESYFSAKAKLFEPGRARVGVINVDDIRGRLLVDASEDPTVSVSLDDALDVRTGRTGTTFRWRDVEVHLPMHGRHNVANALLAAEACRTLGVHESVIAAALATLDVVPGRFEAFELPSEALAVVDYAHTPDALEQALAASRDLAGARGRVTVVFGCGGDRDRGKRPLMGEVACAGADRVIITSDNPRSEDPASIIEQVLAGCAGQVEAGRAQVEADRAAAISLALSDTAAADVVLVAGKGHEQGQVTGTTTLPFDDREQVRLAGGVPVRAGGAA